MVVHQGSSSRVLAVHLGDERIGIGVLVSVREVAADIVVEPFDQVSVGDNCGVLPPVTLERVVKIPAEQDDATSSSVTKAVVQVALVAVTVTV